MHVIIRGFSRLPTDTHLEFDIRTEFRMGYLVESRTFAGLTIWETIAFICEEFGAGIRSRVNA